MLTIAVCVFVAIPASSGVTDPLVRGRSGFDGFSACFPNLRPAFTGVAAGFNYVLAAVDQAAPTVAWGAGFKTPNGPRGGPSRGLIGLWQGRVEGDFYRGRGWSEHDAPQPRDSAGRALPNRLLSVAALSDNEAWAAGWVRRSAGLFAGLIEHKAPGHSWAIVSPADPGGSSGFRGISAVDPDDVWAVGWWTDPDGATHPLAERWDGTRWALADEGSSGIDGELRSVRAFGPSDVWAVGETGHGDPLAMRWNGTTWSEVRLPSVGSGELAGVAGASERDLWAVGWTGRPDTTAALALHRTGHGWAVVPSARPGVGSRLLAVDEDPTGGLWAVGERHPTSTTTKPLAEYWSGSRWRILGTGPTYGYQESLDGVAIFSGHLSAAASGGLDFVYEGCPIQVDTNGFSMARERYAEWGDQVAFSVPAGAGSAHQVKEGLGLFDSGPIAPGASWTFRLRAAGRYPLEDPDDPNAHLTLASRMCCAFQFGTQDSTFQLAWANRPGDARRVYDVEIERPGRSTYVAWITGTTTPKRNFTPDGKPPRRGQQVQYRFRARVINPRTGGRSSWSPATVITVAG